MASNGLWLVQPRYQAPYADTRAGHPGRRPIDTALVALGPSPIRPDDVVVFDTIDDGANIYRNAGWSLPDDRIALIAPGQVIYNELHGAFYLRPRGPRCAVGPAGSVLLVAVTLPASVWPRSWPGERGPAPVDTPLPVGGSYQVFRVRPGAVLLGVPGRGPPGPRPLGGGI